MKHYLNHLVCLCSDEKFGQDAVEHAITTGAIQLSYDLDTDLRVIVGEPGRPETGRYDEFCAAYRAACAANEAVLLDTYLQSGLLEEILRPVPLGKAA